MVFTETMSYKNFFLAVVLSIVACGASSAQTGGQSTDDAAKQKAALAAKNKFVEEQNVFLAQANKLFRDKSYIPAYKIYADVMKKYLEVVPEHPGLPGIVINASIAQRMAAVESYNAAVKAETAATKELAMKFAKDGFTASGDFAKIAVNMAFQADKSPSYSNADTKAQYLTALGNRVDAVSMVAQYVDRAVSDETHQAFLQYLAVEKDTAKKQSAWLKLAKLYFDAPDVEKANAIYAMILKDAPDNPEALFYSAMGLVLIGDKPGLANAAAQLKRFLALAPANDAKRKDAQESLDYLKSEGVVPK